MRIEKCFRMEQEGKELFTFALRGDELLKLVEIQRLDENPKEGVQRKFDYQHALGISASMQGEVLFLENIQAELKGEWGFEQGCLIPGENAKLLVLDGQQRIGALTILPEEKQKSREFTITAHRPLSRKERVAEFLQQGLRKRIDPRLSLVLADSIDKHRSPEEAAAYRIIKRLNSNPNSPLFQCVEMNEREPKGSAPMQTHRELLKNIIGVSPTTLRQKTFKVNLVQLLFIVRRLVKSPHSPISLMNEEFQERSINSLLQATKEVWPSEWQDVERYYLHRTIGITAILELLLEGTTLRASLIGSLDNKDRFKEVFFGIEFDWSFGKYRKPGVKFPTSSEVSRELDVALSRLIARKGRGRKVKA